MPNAVPPNTPDKFGLRHIKTMLNTCPDFDLFTDEDLCLLCRKPEEICKCAEENYDEHSECGEAPCAECRADLRDYEDQQVEQHFAEGGRLTFEFDDASTERWELRLRENDSNHEVKN